MTAAFNDTTINPQVLIPSRKSTAPFTTVSINELGNPPDLTQRDVPSEIIRVTLSFGASDLPGVPSDLGTLNDPLGGGTYDYVSHTFTETTPGTRATPLAEPLIRRLVYTAPTVAAGSFVTVNVTISLQADSYPSQPVVIDPSKPVLQTVRPPAITGTIANEPVASGATLRPFASVRLVDINLTYTARDAGTITLTDAAGNPTDADGLLTGPGLGKTGIGTYALAAASYYDLQNNLQGLVFTPAAVAAGGTRTTTFSLHVSDIATTLATDDNATSVLVIGPAPMPTPPLIAGTSYQGSLIRTCHSLHRRGDACHPGFGQVLVREFWYQPIKPWLPAMPSARSTASPSRTLTSTHRTAPR